MNHLAEAFDPHVFELLRRVEADPDAAAEVLQLAAGYLQKATPMPPELAAYIAGAFLSAALKPRELRAKQLTDDLNLTANNKRKSKVDWLDAYAALQDSNTKADARRKLMKATGIKATRADELISEAAKAAIEIEAAK